MLYADVISFFVTRKIKKIWKIDENNQCWRKKSSYLLNDLRNFNETFRKYVSYDNIKCHKKAGLQPLSGKHIISVETTGWPPPPPLPLAFLGLS